MTTVYYWVGQNLIFVEVVRQQENDPNFFPPRDNSVAITSTRWVTTHLRWRELYFPSNIRFFNFSAAPLWMEPNRRVWEVLLEPQAPPKPKKVVKYDPMALFTALCGNEKFVKKVIR